MCSLCWRALTQSSRFCAVLCSCRIRLIDLLCQARAGVCLSSLPFLGHHCWCAVYAVFYFKAKERTRHPLLSQGNLYWDILGEIAITERARVWTGSSNPLILQWGFIEAWGFVLFVPSPYCRHISIQLCSRLKLYFWRRITQHQKRQPLKSGHIPSFFLLCNLKQKKQKQKHACHKHKTDSTKAVASLLVTMWNSRVRVCIQLIQCF